MKIAHQKDVWEQNAKEDPLWSILTDPNKKDKWDLYEFLATGEEFIDGIIDYGHSMACISVIRIKLL